MDWWRTSEVEEAREARQRSFGEAARNEEMVKQQVRESLPKRIEEAAMGEKGNQGIEVRQVAWLLPLSFVWEGPPK